VYRRPAFRAQPNDLGFKQPWAVSRVFPVFNGELGNSGKLASVMGNQG
jgi:hypothetical protein